MNSVFHLYQLQKIDSQLMANLNRLQGIEQLLLNDHTLQRVKLEVDRIKEDLDGHKIENDKLEESILNRRNKLEQAESSLYSGNIKNPKELQDLQKEISFIKTNITSLEDEQLESMMKIESTEKALHLSLDQLKNAALEFSDHNALLLEEKKHLVLMDQHLMEERELVISQLDADLLHVYDALRSKKKGIAVSKVEDQTCSVCGATLTPAECQSARSNVAYISCPTCGRILYAD